MTTLVSESRHYKAMSVEAYAGIKEQSMSRYRVIYNFLSRREIPQFPYNARNAPVQVLKYLGHLTI